VTVVDPSELLRQYFRSFVQGDKKWRDFHLGVVWGVKETMDVAGEGALAREVLREEVDKLHAENAKMARLAKRRLFG
jgi:hypothetical protein